MPIGAIFCIDLKLRYPRADVNLRAYFVHAWSPLLWGRVICAAGNSIAFYLGWRVVLFGSHNHSNSEMEGTLLLRKLRDCPLVLISEGALNEVSLGA